MAHPKGHLLKIHRPVCQAIADSTVIHLVVRNQLILVLVPLALSRVHRTVRWALHRRGLSDRNRPVYLLRVCLLQAYQILVRCQTWADQSPHCFADSLNQKTSNLSSVNPNFVNLNFVNLNFVNLNSGNSEF